MLPVLKEALALPWYRCHHFGRLLVIPVALTALLWIAQSYWLTGKSRSSATITFSLLQILPYFLIFTFFAVSCHRSILIGDHSVSRFGVPGWSMRETRFYLWTIGIYILGYLWIVLFGVALGVLAFAIGGSLGDPTAATKSPASLYIAVALLSVPFVYVVGRSSLVLPAAAIDLRPGFNATWSLSDGNGWRVAVLVGGIPILFIFFQAFFRTVVGWLTGISSTQITTELGVFSVAILALESLVQYALATLEVAILSISFRELSGWQPSAPPSTHLH